MSNKTKNTSNFPTLSLLLSFKRRAIMFNTAPRSFLRTRNLLRQRPLLPATSSPSRLIVRRDFSVQAIYTSFPASLLRYSPRQTSSLFDIKNLEQRNDDPFDDAVIVSTDSLVYPGVAAGSSCKSSRISQENIERIANWQIVTNGAIFMPNTYTMQEFVRRHYDYYIELEEQGKDMESPLIIRIPKGKQSNYSVTIIMLTYQGTPITNNLVLFHESGARFSLQPSRAMPLEGKAWCNRNFKKSIIDCI